MSQQPEKFDESSASITGEQKAKLKTLFPEIITEGGKIDFERFKLTIQKALILTSAILKHDNSVLYLVRETKATKDFEKLRNIEAEKIRCGRKHFEMLKVDIDVVTSAKEV
jgi:restriction endonuclease